MRILRLRYVIMLSLYITNACCMHTMPDQTAINTLLSNPNTTIESLVPLFLRAQNQKQDAIIQIMLNSIQNDPDKLNQLMTLTRTLYDDNGDNLAITLAKKLDDSSVSLQFIASIEKNITDQSNETFKKNLQQQLEMIKKNLDNAISAQQKSTLQTSDDNWII